MDPLIGLLIWILCVVALVWLAFWILGKAPIEQPVKNFISIIICAIAGVAVLLKLLAVLGYGGHLLSC